MSALTAGSPSPPNALFVYGTLMTDQARHGMLTPGLIKSVTAASIAGRLVDFGQHPGLYLSSEISTRVQGELIEFEALDAILSQLDQEEGPDFKREVVNVTLSSGDGHFAFVYVLTQLDETKPVITSGNWREKADA